ncbi:hypothetical protein PA905_08260 [Planktothrix agardhii CCAP 1459/11A]|uniref:Ycf20-like protein n=1 Tax=Planktothrix agardhii CCAP 1459/11A TaxID=282420 RepID=A0A4P5ZI90_PLAAG|nr:MULTISPECIES: DUF565 domain-containing protein [Planktothrix]GDZ92992.1 hypothetical protein PA905_08260 [Planktothrix agardhii CCAP 1459/11A]
MQNTRLNRLVNVINAQVGRLLMNPWRRISLLIISLLFGIFLALGISTITGQMGRLDVTVALVISIFVEGVNWLVYNRSPRLRQSFWVENLNALKIGLSYGLFLLASMVGS